MVQQQASLADTKFGGLKKKSPMVHDEKVHFDSADHFKQAELLKRQLEGKQEESKKE